MGVIVYQSNPRPNKGKREEKGEAGGEETEKGEEGGEKGEAGEAGEGEDVLRWERFPTCTW